MRIENKGLLEKCLSVALVLTGVIGNYWILTIVGLVLLIDSL